MFIFALAAHTRFAYIDAMTPKELQKWRLDRSLTREQLADLLSPSKKERLSYRVIERWEQGRNAKIPVFLRLALVEVDRKILSKSDNGA